MSSSGEVDLSEALGLLLTISPPGVGGQQEEPWPAVALDQEPLNQQQSLIKEALRDPKKLIGKNYNEDIINEDGQRITLEKTVGPTDNFNLFLAKFSEQKINLKISTFLCASYSRPYGRC